MANEDNQPPLFSETPNREYQPGTTRTWRDDATEEERKALHDKPRDEFDRRDDQAREIPARIRLVTSGMSPRQADNLASVTVAKHILDEAGRERAEREEAERAERERQKDAEIIELLRDVGPDRPEPPAAA